MITIYISSAAYRDCIGYQAEEYLALVKSAYFIKFI